MNKTVNKNSSRVVKWILNIIIVILCFFFVITAGVMIEEIYSAATYPRSEDGFYYNVEGEQYYNMVGGYYSNIFAGYEGNRNMKEYYGVAQYFEAASLYKAYTSVGNTELADIFLERMKKLEAEMGGWSIAKEPIHKQLGIE